MNIVWNENPLLTQIFLDEHEKKELWYKIKIEEMEYLLHGAHFYLQEEYYDLARVKREVDPKYYYKQKGEDKSQLDKRVDELYECFIGDLEHNPHCGDCTCVPASCTKCQAESLLGIDTIKGLRKHEANAISGAFTKPGTKFPKRDEQSSITEAIVKLEQYVPTKSWEGAEAHFERWIEESIRATKWLKNYYDEHFKS